MRWSVSTLGLLLIDGCIGHRNHHGGCSTVQCDSEGQGGTCSHAPHHCGPRRGWCSCCHCSPGRPHTAPALHPHAWTFLGCIMMHIPNKGASRLATWHRYREGWAISYDCLYVIYCILHFGTLHACQICQPACRLCLVYVWGNHKAREAAGKADCSRALWSPMLAHVDHLYPSPCQS